MTNPHGGFQQNNPNASVNNPQYSNPFGSTGNQDQGGNYGENLPAQQGGYQGQGQYYSQQAPVNAPQKSWLVALLLAFFLGGFGAHNFYVGRTGRAIGQLSLCAFSILTSWLGIGVFTAFALSAWVLIEFVMIIAGAGGYDRDSNGIPLKK